MLVVGVGTYAGQPDSRYKLNNGLEVILKENHNSALVAAMVFVRSGSRYESRFENGLTHFLEHLLFDGTATLSREELDRSISDLGGYINAFTRKDMTTYFVLMPRQYIEYGLAVEADMLFNSVFPVKEMAKERRVVIEEINSARDADGAAADAFFTAKAYADTDYERPIMGHRAFIEHIPREAIIDYWKKYYTPDNMTLLVIGGFDSPEMRKTVERVFGSVTRTKGSDAVAPGELHRTMADGKQRSGFITGQHRYDTSAAVTSTHINFSFSAPAVASADYLPLDVLTAYLSLDDISPLGNALRSGPEPLATEMGVSLATYPEFSRLEISALTGRPEAADSIVQTVLRELAGIANLTGQDDILRGVKTSIRCENIYNADKLHYYGFLIAPLMASAGWDFIQAYPDLVDTVAWEHCAATADRWLTNPDYVVTVVTPADSLDIPYEPATLSEDEIREHIATTAFPYYDTSQVAKMVYPAIDSISWTVEDPSIYRREILENGLTVIVKSNPDSRVFGVNVLGKNRTAGEPADRLGITDFVNRCLETGTVNRPGAELSRALADIGANVTLTDNPWIPYDDRYTTRRFSFIKFETINDYAAAGFELLADMVLNPAFDATEVENVRGSMLGVIGRQAVSPRDVARDLFYATLFQNHPYGGAVMGTSRTIAAITVDDLKAHHRRFYASDNMILSIVTSRDTAEVMSWVRELYGPATPSGNPPKAARKPEPVFAPRSAHLPLDKEQVGMYAGGLLPGDRSDDLADLQIATSILSDRLHQNLRERQGLAYSTGAGSRFDRDFGWYYLAILTAADNRTQAFDGLKLQTNKLSYDGPTEAEVASARNRFWGSLLRSQLSRVNQAYYLGVDEYLGRAPGSDNDFLNRLQTATATSVRQAAARYFRTGSWVTVTAGGNE